MSAATSHTSEPTGPQRLSNVSFSDLSARARIREAALEHFTRDGFDRSTIRAIAASAHVSPGLLRHHYGSKEGLRKACDDHVFDILRRVSVQMLVDPGKFFASRHATTQFGPYVARSLLDGSESARAIFDEMVTLAEPWIARADRHRTETSTVTLRHRAAVATAMALGVPLLQNQVSRVLDIDVATDAGHRTLLLAMVDVYTHRLLDAETSLAIVEAVNAASS